MSSVTKMKTYTIQFRMSSDRIATTKLRCRGPVQGKELLRKVMMRHNVPYKYHDRILKEFEENVQERRDDEDTMTLEEIVRRAEEGATEEGAERLASQLWTFEDNNVTDDEKDSILNSIFWTRFYDETGKSSELSREFARVLEKYTSRARALEEKWEIRRKKLKALQTEELNLLAERDEDAISMLRNKQRLDAQWQRHWRALNRERLNLREMFQKRIRRRFLHRTGDGTHKYSKLTWARVESCDEDDDNEEDEHKDEKDDDDDDNNNKVKEEENVVTPLLEEKIRFKKSHLLKFYFGPYDVTCVELGVIACSKGSISLLKHPRNHQASRVDVVRRVSRQIGTRACAVPFKISRNHYNESDDDIWKLEPGLANILFESPELMFPRIAKQLKQTQGISLIDDSESTIRFRHHSPENVVVTRHTSIRAQIIFHWIPSTKTSRDIMKQILRNSARLGVAELLVPLPLQNVTEYMRTFKAVLMELSNAQCIERPHTACGISSQLAMPYKSLGSLERIYFVQKTCAMSRESSNSIAMRLDPVLMMGATGPAADGGDTDNKKSEFVPYEGACRSLRNVFSV